MVVMILLALIFLLEMVGLEIEPTQQLLPEQGERRKKIKDCHPVNTSLLFLQPSVRFPMVETPIPVLPAAGQGRSSGCFIIDQAPLARVLISLC